MCIKFDNFALAILNFYASQNWQSFWNTISWVFFESLPLNISIESCLLRSKHPHYTRGANFEHLTTRFALIINQQCWTFCQIPCKPIFGRFSLQHTKLNRSNCSQIGLQCNTHTHTHNDKCVKISHNWTQNNPFSEHSTLFVHRSRYA